MAAAEIAAGTQGAVNGNSVAISAAIWDELRRGVTQMCADAVIRAVPWQSRTGEPYALTRPGERLCLRLGLGSSEDVFAAAKGIRETDWAKTPYKDHVRRDASGERNREDSEPELETAYEFSEALRDFLNRSRAEEHDTAAPRVRPRIRETQADWSLLPYLFPTRAYTTREIALFLPEDCVVGRDEELPRAWARYVRAVRGAWVRIPEDFDGLLDADPSGSHQGGGDRSPRSAAIIGRPDPGRRVLLGISSIETSDDSWNEAAYGRSAISRERFGRVRTIVNQAIEAVPRPTHLLLPELSLPERWLPTVSSVLSNSGISLIAGLDYQTFGRTTHSSAVLVLEDDRLGFTSYIELRQPKTQPAPSEEETLHTTFGKAWTAFPRTDHKQVYVHFGFCFGVLICSEPQNIAYRKSFQGEVDSLIILPWNQDIDTFAPLVESASLDVHAYVAIVNNRRFGDSRVRAPAKAVYNRDLCRLRGGRNDHLVVVEINVPELRAFQSRARRWPNASDLYKPVPEDFVMSPRRRSRPS